MTYPVKYMPVEHWTGGFAIIDTSFEGQGKTICKTTSLETAHRLTKLLNEDEGYVYAPAID